MNQPFNTVSVEQLHEWVDESMSEANFQRRILALLEHSPFEWKVYHARTIRTFKKGRVSYLTPVTSKGFPDLVLATNGRTIYAELKRQKNAYADKDQKKWLNMLTSNEANEVYVWRPSHWQTILDTIMFNEVKRGSDHGVWTIKT